MTSSRQVRGLLPKFNRFLGVGALGFLIDAIVFFTLASGLGLHYAWARVAASFVALVATWLLNRRLTFSQGRVDAAPVEFLRYLGASAAGAGANLAALSLIAPYDAAWAHGPSYVVGAAVGLVVNFFLYDKFVFHGRAGSVSRDAEPPEQVP
jgi:putative flippase GtrA